VLKVFLLGQFAVERDGAPIRQWGGRQTCELVKVLAAAGGRPLSKDQLVEILWTEPPLHAERDLKVLASRARRALSDPTHQIIVSASTGYAFAKRDWTDTLEMERLIGEGTNWARAGRLALAEASYRSAIELYRGPFLGDDLYADWIAPHRERYRRLFLDTLLMLGGLLFERHDPGALALTERLLAEEPFSDVAAQAVMLARAVLGDASAALKVYARFRANLLDELGASPSLETDRLHIAILRDEDLGAWPRPPHTQVPTRSTELPPVGRTREREVLIEALDRTAAGQGGVVLLVGEPGIGKTHLLNTAVALAGVRFEVLLATGREREQHLPFQLLAEAIRSTATAPDELRQAAGPFADALTALVPELASADTAASRADIPQVTRRRILEGTLHLLRSLSQQRPLLVALDDLHWADPSSVDAVAFCAHRLRTNQVLWLGAIRPGESQQPEALQGIPHAQSLELTRFSGDDIRVLLKQSNVPDTLVERVAVESDGVPFYALEIARALSEAPDSSQVAEGIKRALQQRVQSAGATSRRVLEAAAVLGDGFELDDVARLAELSPQQTLETLEQLGARRLVMESDDRRGGFRFGHDLIRRGVYEAMGSGRRRLLHGRAADMASAADPAVHGRHALEAGRFGHAAQLFRQAADAAMAGHATREAEVLYEAALSAARQARSGRTVVLELIDRIGRTRSARGDYAIAAEAHQSAYALAPDEQAAARQSVRLGWLAFYTHEPDRAVDLARDAERRGDDETRGEGLLLQAKLAHSRGEVERAARYLAGAVDLVDAEALQEVRALEVAVANHRARFGEAVARFESAADGLRRAGLLRPLASAMVHAGIALSARGDYARAIAVLQQSATDCQQAGAEHLQARLHNTLGGIYYALGQHERGKDEIARALELATQTGFEEAVAHALVAQADAAVNGGDSRRARGLLDRADRIANDDRIFYSWRIRLRWLLVLARLELLEGRHDSALVAVEQAAASATATSSLKYVVLSKALRAEILGIGEDGPRQAYAALELARSLESPPLLREAARAVAKVGSGAGREQAQRIVEAIDEHLLLAGTGVGKA
jgi:DNA-binding SARP family transcriptional activator/tetratricopeptide (TPR) repeat protein